MTPRRAITPRDCRASLGPSSLFASLRPRSGLAGLTAPSGPPRIGNYVMAGMHLPTQRTKERRTLMHAPTIHAEHRSDDRARDAALSRVHHHRTRPRSTHPRQSRSTRHRCPTCREWQPIQIPADHARAKAIRRGSFSWTAPSWTGSGPAIAKDDISSHQPIPYSLASTRCSTGCGTGSVRRRRISHSQTHSAGKRPVRPTRSGHSRRDAMNIEVKILRNEHGKPAEKLADAEIHFIGGELEGLKLVGFAIWRAARGPWPKRHLPGAPIHRAR